MTNFVAIDEASAIALIDKVLAEMEERFGKKEPIWLQEIEAMNLLGIRSKTTLQKLRDNDEIRFSQPRRKIILYYKPSLLEYLDKHSNI